MKHIHSVPSLSPDAEAGLTLIEVLIAMMIFTIISLGLAYGIANSLVITRESRSREAAANLAEQQIDLDRSKSDVFSFLGTTTWNATVNGTVFQITRSADWVSTNNSTIACGAGGGTLQYVRDNVSVTWAGQSAATPAVHADTLISPNSRINDPTLGTIIVSVTGASGAGTSGITAKIVPSAVSNGAVALTTAPAATDTNGCTFALKVTPGNYDVSLSKPGYVDMNQNPTPVQSSRQITAGTASAVPFTYDAGVQYSLNYASNYSGTPTATIPTNLDTTFISTGGVYTAKLAGVGPLLYPFSGGYTTIAGAYVGPAGASPTCVDVDPSSWTTPASNGAVGQTPAPDPTVNNTATAKIAMGVATITGLTKNDFLTAVSKTPPTGSGDPGCAISTTYTFAKLAGTSSTIALPYGSWTIYMGTTSGATTGTGTSTIQTSKIAKLTDTAASTSTTIVTFDPRTVTP